MHSPLCQDPLLIQSLSKSPFSSNFSCHNRSVRCTAAGLSPSSSCGADQGTHPHPVPITCTHLNSLENTFLQPPPLFQALINEADSVTNMAGGYLFMKYQHHAILKASKALRVSSWALQWLFSPAHPGRGLLGVIQLSCPFLLPANG